MRERGSRGEQQRPRSGDDHARPRTLRPLLISACSPAGADDARQRPARKRQEAARARRWRARCAARSPDARASRARAPTPSPGRRPRPRVPVSDADARAIARARATPTRGRGSVAAARCAPDLSAGRALPDRARSTRRRPLRRADRPPRVRPVRRRSRRHRIPPASSGALLRSRRRIPLTHGIEAGTLMRHAIDRDAALEADAHAAERAARLARHGRAECACTPRSSSAAASVTPASAVAGAAVDDDRESRALSACRPASRASGSNGAGSIGGARAEDPRRR